MPQLLSTLRLFGRYDLMKSALALKEPPGHAGLADDAGQRSNREFGMVRDRNGRRGATRSLLHDDVTSTLSND